MHDAEGTRVTPKLRILFLCNAKFLSEYVQMADGLHAAI